MPGIAQDADLLAFMLPPLIYPGSVNDWTAGLELSPLRTGPMSTVTWPKYTGDFPQPHRWTSPAAGVHRGGGVFGSILRAGSVMLVSVRASSEA